MKLGIVTSILESYEYERMIDAVAKTGFQCVEAACWPQAKAERRYAGVCHIDVGKVLESDEYCGHILQYSGEHNIDISSLAFYPNTMDANQGKRKENISHLLTVIKASSKLGVNMVTTFIGRDQNKSVEENLELVRELWPPIIQTAEEYGVKIAIENCPMLFGREEWPGGQNLMTSTRNWERIFEILDSENLGINYDPSHFIWQFMDYIRPIYMFKDKIFHVHFKDIKIYREKLDEVGIMAYPLEYMAPKLPGFGDVDWGKFVSALTDVGYDGYACIEVEDRAFEDSEQRILESLMLSKRYLQQYVI